MRTTRPGESALLLLDVVDLLSELKIDYAVIGALAASVHGAVRASMDADVVLAIPMNAVAGLAALLQVAGLHTEIRRGDIDDPIPGLLAVDDPHGNRVDLLLGLKGLERAAFVRLLEVPFQGRVLRFIGREDFIAMKAFAGGPLDLLDAQRALLAAGESLDAVLVRRLARGYGDDAAKVVEQLLAAGGLTSTAPPPVG